MSKTDYFADACYEAWRRGMDTDRISRDQCRDAYDEGISPSELISRVRHQDVMRSMERHDEIESEDEYWDSIDNPPDPSPSA